MGRKSKVGAKLKPICVSPRTYRRLGRRRAPGQTYGGIVEELLDDTEGRE